MERGVVGWNYVDVCNCKSGKKGRDLISQECVELTQSREATDGQPKAPRERGL